MRSHWRSLVVALLLAGTGLLFTARSSTEIIAPHAPLNSFPKTLGGWTSVADIPMTQDVLDILGPGDFLLRDYRGPTGNNVDLFLAYFPSQRTGDTIHSPKHCLPGAGWIPVHSDRITINVPGHEPFLANRYLIAKGQDRQLVVYWYWAHDRAVASEYAAKFYLITDSIKMRRSDGSLIRITTPLAQKGEIESAGQTLTAFAANIVPLINNYVPR